jgi:7-cyano-7-deazaguanine reductase
LRNSQLVKICRGVRDAKPSASSPKPFRDNRSNNFLKKPYPRTIVPGTPFIDELQCFDNSFPDREYDIEIVCPEFTSICPKTGQPDFGTLTFRYVPDRKCVELKSLKLYLQRFRNEGIFYENVTNRIFSDFLAVVAPKRAELESRWGPRGGITSVITVRHPQPAPEKS